MMNDNRIRKVMDGIRLQPGAKERIREKLEAELGRPLEDCPVSVKPRRGTIPAPLDKDRIRLGIEAELGKSLRDCKVTVRPRRGRFPKLLAAAAMLAVVIGSAALLLWPLIRPASGQSGDPELLTDPTASPEATAFETPAPTPELTPEPTPAPSPYELGAIVDEGSAAADNGSTLTWALDDKGLLLISGEGDMEDYFGSYQWQTSWIDQLPWQGYLTSVRSAVIEPGLRSVAANAFSNCRELREITIPESVSSIGDSAFHSCSSLERLSMPPQLRSIGDYAFTNCSSLTELTIPESVTTIGAKAFSHCGLESVTIPGGVTAAGDYAFEYCGSLNSVILREGVRSIGDYSFYVCDRLSVVVIPASVTEIGEGAFAFCDSLAEVYYAGSAEDWEKIRIARGNDSLLAAELCTDADTGLFSSAALPSRELGTIVDEGSAVAENGETLSWALDRKGLLLISGSGEMEDFYPFLHYKSFDASTGSIKEYSGASYPWLKHLDSIRTVIIEPGLRSIGLSAFTNAHALTSVQIPETVKTIGDGAFSNCGLDSLALPEGLESIGEYAFSNCGSLRELSLPDSLRSIGKRAFSNCGLERVTIPGGVEALEESTFDHCASLRSVTIRDGLRTIGWNAFCECTALTELSLPDSLTEIRVGAFFGCSGLTGLSLPESLKEIGSAAFYGCGELSDVYYPGSEEQWKRIAIGENNVELLRAEIRFGGEG